MLSFILLSLSHVPTYDTCKENCCTPPKEHTISQVIYLHGPGGLEIHIKDEKNPFDILNSEMIDVDVILKDKIDPNSYDIYIGCGGCIGSEDPLIPESLVGQKQYDDGKLEPFTQTSYYSILNKETRKFNSSILYSDFCKRFDPDIHFTIRLVDNLQNRSNPIIWAPVIGLAEKFTLLELIEFPIYILKNHGKTWNDIGYTFWIWLFLGAPLLLNITREIVRYAGVDVLNIFPWRNKKIDIRELFYEIAIIGFIAAACEEITHLIYAQVGIPISFAFYLGLFIVILLAQGLGLIFTVIVWRALHHRKDNWCSASPYWAPFEILTGIGFLFIFGSGFFVGPACIIIAGTIRLRELCWDSNVNNDSVVEIVLREDVIAIPQTNRMKSRTLGFIT